MPSLFVLPGASARRRFWSVVALAAPLALAACGDKNKNAAPPGAPGAGAPPPPVVGVVTVQPGTVAIKTELPGRLEAARVAQVRARATGVVLRRLFTEGSEVRAGQPLFQIENAPYMATLQSARASVAKAEANLRQTSTTARRYAPLAAANAISKQEYDNALAAERAARADLLAAQAAVRNAQISVDYARVTAPISGRIGRAQVTEGAMVSATEGTLLATIQQMNPMMINVTQSASTVMQLRKAIASGQELGPGGNPAVKVILEDGTVYDQPARLLFTDVTVDPATGQVNLRAEVPNPRGVLFPGLYVRIRIEQSRIDNAVLIPQQAVTRGTTGDSVMVVNADGSFAPRPVKVGPADGNQWIITDGLKPGDKVIVDGMATVMMMHAQKVTPQPWQPPAVASAPAAAASAAPAPAAAASSPAAAGSAASAASAA